jgi:antirestriction protein
MSDDNKYRVWVGCLACYNEGRLVGEWFDAEDAPTNEDDFNEAVPGHKKIRQLNPHEEIWVFDHENSPVSGEYSPMDAVQYAEWLEGIDNPEALKAWLSNGNEFNEDTAEEMQEAYQGEYESDQDFAQEMADQLGVIQENPSWPYTCIDWEWAARELMYDYWSSDGHYFRNM